MDFLAYADKARSGVAIAGEAKRFQRDAVALSASLEVCGARGDHPEADCTERKNHHRKYVGLLKFRPRILWVVDPKHSPLTPISSFVSKRAAAASAICVAQTPARSHLDRFNAALGTRPDERLTPSAQPA